jgi:hypothetical protein
MHPTGRIWPTTYRLIELPTFETPRPFRIWRRGRDWEIVSVPEGQDLELELAVAR